MGDLTEIQVKVFHIRHSPKHDIFCGSVCKQKCIQSKNKGTQLVYLNKTENLRENCYAVFMANMLRDMVRMQMGNCIIPAYLSLNDKGGQINLYLDSGAEVSVVSIAILHTFLEIGDITLQHTKAVLRGPDDNRLSCKGTIDLLVQIGNEEHICIFYVLASGQNVLLSLPDIKRFGLIIDTQNQLCHNRNSIDICGNVRVQHVEVCSSMYHLCTVRRSYTINGLTKIRINVQFVDKGLENKYFYKSVHLYDCTCAITITILCSTCNESYGLRKLCWNILQ